MKALMGDSNNTIAGLQNPTDGEPARKVSYGKKKPFKKPEVAKVEVVVPIAAVEEKEDDDVKDDWDASDEEEEKVEAKVEEVKDDWDASESEEEKEVVKAAPAAKGEQRNLLFGRVC